MNRNQRTAGGAAWTIMVYMVADDEDGVFTNVHIGKELAAIRAAVARHPDARIAVQADVRNGPVTRHFVGRGGVIDEEIAQVDPSSTRTIREFIKFGLQKHSSAHYMVIFWGHGFGPAGLKYGRFVPPTTLREGLLEGFGRIKTPIDIVSFMSCQMNTIELAYEASGWRFVPFNRWKRVASHIVASQGSVEPNEPFPYDEVLSLISHQGADPRKVATGLVDVLNANDGSANAVRFAAPFSAVDVAAAEQIATAMKSLATDIVAAKPFNQNHLRLSPLQKAMHDALEAARTHDLALLDLGRLGKALARLSESTAANAPERSLVRRVKAAGDQLFEAVDRAFVLRRHVSGKDTGASVFCPTHHDPGPGRGGVLAIPPVEVAVAEDIHAYRTSSFATKTTWNEVVDLARDA